MTPRLGDLDLFQNPDVRHLARRFGCTWPTCTLADLEARADALTDGELAASMCAAAYLTDRELAALAHSAVFWRLLDRVAERTGRAPATLKAFLLLGLPIRWPWWRPTGAAAGRRVRADRRRASAAMQEADIPADPRRRPLSRRGLVLPVLTRRSLPISLVRGRVPLLVEDHRLGTVGPVTLDGLDLEEVMALSVFAQMG